jgi:MFS transporter, DHA1 family, chloramphenicol resistance protein
MHGVRNTTRPRGNVTSPHQVGAGMPAPTADTRTPRAVHLLGPAVFALGSSALMLSSLLPDIADDMHVSIPRAALLSSAFAIGYPQRSRPP